MSSIRIGDRKVFDDALGDNFPILSQKVPNRELIHFGDVEKAGPSRSLDSVTKLHILSGCMNVHECKKPANASPFLVIQL